MFPTPTQRVSSEDFTKHQITKSDWLGNRTIGFRRAAPLSPVHGIVFCSSYGDSEENEDEEDHENSEESEKF